MLICIRYWFRDHSGFQSFEDAIKASPADHALRLIYSDWLMEQGYVEDCEHLGHVASQLEYLRSFDWESKIEFWTILIKLGEAAGYETAEEYAMEALYNCLSSLRNEWEENIPF